MPSLTTQYFIRGCGRWCPRNILRLSFCTRSGGRKIERVEEEEAAEGGERARERGREGGREGEREKEKKKMRKTARGSTDSGQGRIGGINGSDIPLVAR